MRLLSFWVGSGQIKVLLTKIPQGFLHFHCMGYWKRLLVFKQNGLLDYLDGSFRRLK